MRGLDNIYAQIEETNLFCLNVDHLPFTFKEVVKENCWRNAIEQEIYAIEEKKKRNTHTCTHTHTHTWELSTLPLGQRTIGVK